MASDIGCRWLRGKSGAKRRRNEVRELVRHCPGDDDECREECRGRQRANRRLAAPGDRDRRCGQRREHDQRLGWMGLQNDDDRGCKQVRGERSRGHAVDAPGCHLGAEIEPGDHEERGKGKAGDHVKEARQKRGVGRSRRTGHRPDKAERHRGDGEPTPQPRAREREGRSGHHREIDVERPVVRRRRLHQHRHDLGAHEAERRERRPVQQRRGERREGNDAKQHERRPWSDEVVESVGGKDGRIGDRGARGRQDARDVCCGAAADGGRLAAPLPAPQPLARGDEQRREKRTERDPYAGADPALLNRIAHQENAAQRERDAADPYDPTGAEALLEAWGSDSRRPRGRGWRGVRSDARRHGRRRDRFR